MEKISVIIPVYNTEKHLSECITSVIKQSYKNLEIILVDDGSTDNSLELCNSFVQKDKRIAVFHKENGGVSSARNLGLSKATGKWIQFVDSDDFIQPNMCEILLNTAMKDQSDCVICGYISIEKQQQTDVSPNIGKNAPFSLFKEDFNTLYGNFFFHSPCNKLYRKECIKVLFNENISLGEDLLFNLSYFQNTQTISIIPQCLYLYNRTRDTSLTGKYRSDLYENAKCIYLATLEFCQQVFHTTAFSNVHMLFFTNAVCFIRHFIYYSNTNNSTTLTQIKKIFSDPVFMSAAKKVQSSSIQHRFVQQCAKRKQYRPVIWFYKIKKLIRGE